MSRRRRGSARMSASSRPTPERVRPGPTTPRSSLRPLWIAGGALAIAVVLGVLVLRPFGIGSPGSGSPRASAAGTNCPTSQPPALAAGETRVVTIATELGAIELTLDASLSPIAVGNFVALASCGYYDNVVFHRAATLRDGTPFVIQGGDPDGTGQGGPGYTIQDEPVTATYGRGTVAMARTGAPNSVGSQFFIVLDDGARPVLESFNTYQIIGTVSAGMETADAILAGADAENPSDPVTMTSVTVRAP